MSAQPCRRWSAWQGILVALTVAGCTSSAPRPPSPTPTAASTPTPVSATAQPGPSAPPLLDLPLSDVPSVAGHPPRSRQPWFLAIGDSITSGYTRDPARQGGNSGWPVQLESQLAASGRPWQLYDVACPAETTETYRTLCPQRSSIPSLAQSSQREAALGAIRDHLDGLRLILVDLGSNDLLRGALGGAPVNVFVDALRLRLETIVAELREAAPRARLVLADYYDPFENSVPQTLSGIALANAMVRQVAAGHGASVAGFFAAINTPAPPDADLCRWLDCDHGDPVHPTIAGHQRLAAAALAAIPG